MPASGRPIELPHCIEPIAEIPATSASIACGVSRKGGARSVRDCRGSRRIGGSGLNRKTAGCKAAADSEPEEPGQGERMPQVNATNKGPGNVVMLSAVAAFHSEHFHAQLMQQLAWTVGDADASQ